MPERSAVAPILALAAASKLAGGLIRTIAVVGGCSMNIKQIVLFCHVHHHIGLDVGKEADGRVLRHS